MMASTGYAELRSCVEGVRCTWHRRARRGGSPLIVPDGCVDLVWFSDGRLEVAGPDTAARLARIDVDVEIVGVRFHPGHARRVLGMPVGHVRDQRLALDSLGGRWEVASKLLTDQSGAALPQRRALLLQLARVTVEPTDVLVTAAVRRLTQEPNVTIAALADSLGVSGRTLQRRFVDEVGYPPKTFARIARVHRLVRIAAATPDLSSAALAAGFANQAHMSDEVRALTTLTTVRFLEDRGAQPPIALRT